MAFKLEEVLEALRHVSDPETGKDIVSSQMVESLTVDAQKVSFSLTHKNANSPFKSSIEKACKKAIAEHLSAELEVSITSLSKISVGRIDDQKVLPGVKNIIAVASGKGGVGKSTVATNLAVAMAKTGARVGLLDADIYGPSVPKMLGVEGARPQIKKINNRDLIIPAESYGVKLLSIGFFVKAEDALIWRGAMATGALNQLINDAAWGDLDYLFIDLPPGTGDIHLTMVQAVPVTGAVIVTTPQNVALADALKGVGMFRTDKINVPVLGMIENMSWFTPAELPYNKYYIFGKDGGAKLAKQVGVELLGQIPLVQSVCEDGDNGRPSALNDDSPVGQSFVALAATVAQKIEERNKNLEPTKKVEIDPNASCAV